MSRRPDKGASERNIGDRRRAILDAATTLFVERGFDGATTDEITRRAGASKETVYHHFGSKLGLFDAVVQHLASGLSGGLACPDDTRSVAEALDTFGRNYLILILRPEVLGLFRLVIGEGAHLPELGKLFYQRAPTVTIALLAEYLRRHMDEGHLRAADAEMAAVQFLGCLRGDLHMRALLTQAVPTATEIDRCVAETVDLFLRCFGV